jgi:hypothetical protein
MGLRCWFLEALPLGTEAAWIRKRRDDVTRGLQEGPSRSMNSVMRRAAKRGAAAFSEGHISEATFLNKKRRIAKLRAINDKTMLPEEISAQDVEDAGIALQHEFHLDKIKCRKECKNERVLALAGIVDMQGMAVWLEPGVTPNLISKAFQENRFVLETQRSQVDMFVVRRPDLAGQRVRWTAIIRGARVATPLFVTSGGRRGSSLKYHRAVQVKRKVWMSDNFQAKHETLTSLFKIGMALPGSRWKPINTEAGFFHAARGAISNNKPMTVAGLITPSDVRRVPLLKHLACAMMGAAFMDFICRIDEEASTSGMCGM